MHSHRVLVLDDEYEVRETIQRQLGNRGFETAGAASATEALNSLSRVPFDLVVCDLCLPGQNGIAFLQEATTRFRETGVVLMSGTHDLQLAVEAMRLGALDYISKPFTADQIAATVAGAITRLRERAGRERHIQRL